VRASKHESMVSSGTSDKHESMHSVCAERKKKVNCTRSCEALASGEVQQLKITSCLYLLCCE